MPLEPNPIGDDVSIDGTRLIQEVMTFDRERTERAETDAYRKVLELERANLEIRMEKVTAELDRMSQQKWEPREEFFRQQADIIDECRMHLGIMEVPFSESGTAIQEFRNGNIVPLLDALHRSRTIHLAEVAAESPDRVRLLLQPHEASRISRTVVAGEEYAQTLLERNEDERNVKRKRFLFRNSIAHVMDPSAKEASVLLSAAPQFPNGRGEIQIQELVKVLGRKSSGWVGQIDRKTTPRPLIDIRWMIQRDHEQVLDIHNRSYRDEISMDYMQSHLRRSDTIGMVADLLESGKPRQVLGSMIYQLRKNYIDVVYMSTDPHFRRHSIGEALVGRLLEKVFQQNRLAVGFTIDLQGKDALTFLLNCGADSVVPVRPEESDSHTELAKLFLIGRPSVRNYMTIQPQSNHSEWASLTDSFLTKVA